MALNTMGWVGLKQALVVTHHQERCQYPNPARSDFLYVETAIFFECEELKVRNNFRSRLTQRARGTPS